MNVSARPPSSAEGEGRNSEATLQAILSASPDLIMILDRDGHLRRVNPALQRILGDAHQDQIGKNATEWEPIHPDDRAAFTEAQQRVRSGQDEQAVVRTRFRHAEGNWVLVETHTRRLDLDEGLVIVGHDLTRQATLEEDLRQAKLHAEQAEQAKSEYLSTISHELRTLLNAISGFAQLLELDEPRREQQEGIRHILSGAEHLLALINQVLDFAAIEAGRLRLSLEPVAAAEVVAEAVDLIRPLADQRAIQLAVPAPDCDDYLFADRQRLRQLLVHLLSNAVKYNCHGGSVRLGFEHAAGERLRVSVTDTGPGIAAEHVNLLFIPFKRLGGEQRGSGGIGLGLPMSRRLAQAMGGTLEVTTVAGQGSTFWFELPLAERPVHHAERQPAEPAPPQEQASLAGPALTVLCIEDNLSNLRLIEQIVSCWPSVKLISAAHPQLGLDLANERRPDLVLLDLHLPGMSGEEVLRRLRDSTRTADIPVVILTADATPGLTDRLLEQGARAFLTKPLDVKEVLTLLDDIATEQHRADALSASADLVADLGVDPSARRR